MNYSEEKMVKVSYYEWSFNRYGDKDYDYVVDWVPDHRVESIRNDSAVSDFQILEQK